MGVVILVGIESLKGFGLRVTGQRDFVGGDGAGRIFLTFRFYANMQLRVGESVFHLLQNNYR